MNKTKKLLSNTLIFALGTFGSKLLQYLLLPYYTALLSTNEYGIIDNLQNIGALLIPIVSLTISESIFRYAMDAKTNKQDVFSIGMIISLVGSAIFGIISIALFCFMHTTYIFLIYFYVVANILRTNASQYIRAIGKTKLFAIDNIVQTTLILLFNIYFLSVRGLKIDGYMFAYILGNACSFIFIFITAKLYKELNFKTKTTALTKEMTSFSIPLIPNTICWWISNCSDRFMITALINASANGIYAIAYKIPTVMTLFVNIFLQAWQISANEEYENNQLSSYYTEVFKYIGILSCFMAIGLNMFCKFIMSFIVAEAYFEAWKYIPFLSLSVVFFSKAQFLGTLYTTFKKTSLAFYTNLIAAIVNIIGNYFLLIHMGTIGAAISTAFSYLVLWISRQLTVKQFIDFKLNLKNEVLSIILIIISIIVTMNDLGLAGYFIQATLLVFALLLFLDDVKKIINKLLSAVLKR